MSLRGFGSKRKWAIAAVIVMAAAHAPAAPSVAEAQVTHDDSTAARSQAALTAPLSGFADEGVFRVYVNEEVIVNGDFTWSQDGAYEGEYTLAMAGQQVTSTLAIQVDDRGLWTRMDMKTALGPVTIVRDGGVAEIRRSSDTTTVQLQPNTVLFENFSPALIAHAIAVYDETAGGRQPISIFIVPSVVMDGYLERLDPVERAVGGIDMTFKRYIYGLPGVEVTVYVDDEGRVVFGDVPQQHAAYVREGYEALLQAGQDTLVSSPDYEVRIESNVGVPMRDGIELATDIYRPEAEGTFPVILVRTPYKKEMNELQAKFFSRRGYVYAVQDCRGRFSSPGTWEPFVNEAEDGYDTVEWLAEQPWSSGKVGMIGASYLGWVQWWAARNRPPHLTTIIPNVSPPDPYFNIPYEYGAFFLLGSIWWADILESEATADLSGKTITDVSDKEYAIILRDLPVIDLDVKILGEKNPYWRKWIEHPDNDGYWEPASFLDHLEDLDIPVFHQSGWFDGDGIGSKLNYLKMASHGHPHQKLVLGPWGHTDQATRRIGDLDFGEEAIVDLQTEYIRWLDHWLKGVDNGIESEPLVSVFVMGANKWLHGNTYPLEGTVMTKYYLDSEGDANTSGGDGVLTTEAPSGDSPPDKYVYDPGDPTPSPTFYVSPEQVRRIERARAEEEDASGGEAPEAEEAAPAKPKGKSPDSVEEEMEKRRAYHAKVDEERRDILVYDTPALATPLTFAGPISAVLYASTSAKDTDWFMRLSRVDVDGRVHRLVEGKIRARHRASFSRPELLDPGKVYQYRIDLWQTGITIPAGERLRVEVASASFPVFSRNLNTGGHNETSTEFVTAEQTVYHDAVRPSYVLLPVIP
jgi:putative CocE/NonD family hydrolase